MKIDIYFEGNCFIAVKHGARPPERAKDWKFFKTIDLKPDSKLIGGPRDPKAVIEAIKEQGWGDMGSVEVRVEVA